MGLLSSTTADWMHGQLVTAGGIAATYTRGATTLSVTVCISGGTDRRQEDLGPTWQWREALLAITPSEISTIDPPQVGDTITMTLGGESVVWAVVPQGDGLKAWRWDDWHVTYMVAVKRQT